MIATAPPSRTAPGGATIPTKTRGCAARIVTFRLLVLVGCMATVGGCEKALFPANLPRTPYERYQQLHGLYRPSDEQNAYGGEQPALRDRLRPLEQY